MKFTWYFGQQRKIVLDRPNIFQSSFPKSHSLQHTSISFLIFQSVRKSLSLLKLLWFDRPRLLSFNAKSGSRISHPMIHSLILIYNFRQLEVFKKIYFKKFFHQWKFSGTWGFVRRRESLAGAVSQFCWSRRFLKADSAAILVNFLLFDKEPPYFTIYWVFSKVSVWKFSKIF